VAGAPNDDFLKFSLLALLNEVRSNNIEASQWAHDRLLITQDVHASVRSHTLQPPRASITRQSRAHLAKREELVLDQEESGPTIDKFQTKSIIQLSCMQPCNPPKRHSTLPKLEGSDSCLNLNLETSHYIQYDASPHVSTSGIMYVYAVLFKVCVKIT
jgi:hypothetical protein